MKVVNWFKEHGLWDKLIAFIEKFGVPKATGYCASLAPVILKELCGQAIDEIIKYLKK